MLLEVNHVAINNVLVALVDKGEVGEEDAEVGQDGRDCLADGFTVTINAN
jgi:hypothetical protein